MRPPSPPSHRPLHHPLNWLALLIGLVLLGTAFPMAAARFQGRIVDADTGLTLASRVYLRDGSGRWLFVQSAVPEGSALPYEEQWVPMAQSVERHTTISAHSFQVELPAGAYELSAQRGKEYFPVTETLHIGTDPVSREFRLHRWIDLASRGWYSGETHVHRRLTELTNVMLAEDLNVAFPVTYWTIHAGHAPDTAPSPLRKQPSPFGPRSDQGQTRIPIDATHVILPRNTEYEVFRVDGKPHLLGALFVLNHKSVFTQGVPPVRSVAEQAHREGALLDLDKHSWPWSMMLVPIAKIDLFELSNNSVWQTTFGFRQSPVPVPEYMHVEKDSNGLTEWGWIDFGLQNYYALLNCGFNLQPTAGTASGVHPVPLGWSRVYVHLEGPFSAEAWIEGLKQGRSFVTTGPMLLARMDGRPPGERFAHTAAQPRTYRLTGESLSARPLEALELFSNGERLRSLAVTNERTREGAYRTGFAVDVPVDSSGWMILRSLERQPDGRIRFAHTAPWHFTVPQKPLRPRREEIDTLIQRMTEEISRNRSVLAPSALAEFEEARRIYESIKANGVR